MIYIDDMNYILLKEDGSILKEHMDYYIQQGNIGSQIFFGRVGAQNTDIGIAVCTLPNGTQTTIQGTYETGRYEENGEQHAINGFVFTLGSEETNYSGGLMMSLAIYRSQNRLVNYPLYVVINETGLMSDTDTGVTVEEINSYLRYIQGFLRIDNGILVVDSMTYEIAAEREVGQIFFSRDTGLFYIKNSASYPFYERLTDDSNGLPYVSDNAPENTNVVWIDTNDDEEEESIEEIVEDNYGVSQVTPLVENNYGNNNVSVEDNYGREN